MTLVKHWVRQTYWTDDEHLEPSNPFKRAPMYLAADVDALLDDPQALAAYLVERQKGQP